MSFSRRRSLAIGGLATGAFCLHDLYFIPAGAKAFRLDNPNTTVQFLDTGHFALETHLEEIALAMRAFLGRLPPHEPRLNEVPAVIEEVASLLSGTNVNERRA
jgi:hypothetical protein